MLLRFAALLLGCAVFSSVVAARGPSPYLPLNLSPEMERQIERLLMLADYPVISRPIAAATVLDALPKACSRDRSLCDSVRRYLERYMKPLALDEATLEVATSSDGPVGLANRRGLDSDDSWAVSAQGHWQITDHVLLSAGGVAYDGQAIPTGSLLSMGWDFAQLDIGYREHWLSPFTSSAMALSTNAPTMPSITLSNYAPLTRWHFQYEIFLAEMDYSDRIAFQDGFTFGNPRLAGLRLAIQPAPGWILAANRVLQFGGGARGGTSFGDFLDALFRPHEYDNTSDSLSSDEQFGNQVAALTSRFIFPGRKPFSVYFEYAGEDSSYEGNFRLGNAALSMGLSMPNLIDGLDLTVEASERQNAWYVHGVYQDGLTGEGRVIGHWGADQRTFGDEVGAQAVNVQIGWRQSSSRLFNFGFQALQNENYSSESYSTAYAVSASYATAFRGFTVGAEVRGGRDVFGEDYTRLSGFARFGAEWAQEGRIGAVESDSDFGAALFVEAGMNASDVQIRLGDGSPKTTTGVSIAPHVGVGARRAVSERSDLGVRVELDRIDDELFMAVRALDYRYRFRSPLAWSLFVGAARYDLATPAYGYYLGTGMQWRDVLPRMDVGIDLRYADKVARDKLLPSDPAPEPRPDIFYDITGATLSLSYRW
jgi:hypothetical protein